jgi:hypothetical protein
MTHISLNCSNCSKCFEASQNRIIEINAIEKSSNCSTCFKTFENRIIEINAIEKKLSIEYEQIMEFLRDKLCLCFFNKHDCIQTKDNLKLTIKKREKRLRYKSNLKKRGVKKRRQKKEATEQN